MLNKKTILIVEDEKVLRNALDDKLAIQGFKILDAENGQEGLALALVEHPDLILLDIVMPKMNGMDVLKELRADEWGKTVPVIILTNLLSSDEERNRDITRLEPTFYFIKTDIKIEEVVEKIKEKLELL